MGVAIGGVFPFIPVILIANGFDVLGVGVVTALTALAFAVAVPAWGHFADVVVGRPRALQIAAIAAAAALALTLLQVPPLVIALCYIGFAAGEAAFAPLSDALAVNAVRDPRRDYARVRLLFSLSFAVATIGAGFLYDQTGYGPAPIIFALGALVVVASAAFTPDVERAKEAASARFGSVGVAFASAPRLPLVLVALGLMHVGILAGFTFLSVRLQELGAEPSTIALSAGVAALTEVLGFLVMGALAQRLGIRAVFIASAAIYGACFVSWMFLDSPILIVASRVATGFAFAGIAVAAVLTIAALLPGRLQATGQALYQTTAFGVAAVIADVGGGLIYGSLGYAVVFGLAALAAVLAAVVGAAALPRGRARFAEPSRAA